MARPRKDQKADQARLDAEALDLYGQLGSYRRVGERQGVNFTTARDRMARALARTNTDRSRDWVAEQLAGLDFIENRVLDVLLAHHVKVDHGKLIMVDGSPMVDDKPVLEAADRLFKVWDQRAKLTGSYAPTEVKVEHTTAADAELERLAGKLASRADQESPVASESTP